MQSRRNRELDPLGEFEMIVLMAVLRLGANAYGMRIHTEIEDCARRHCSYGALYTTLDRLEQKAYLSSATGEPTAARGGRAKKYFKVESAGKAALRQSYAATRRMALGIEAHLEGAR
jgi:PadR family transcriptional regulator PadR